MQSVLLSNVTSTHNKARVLTVMAVMMGVDYDLLVGTTMIAMARTLFHSSMCMEVLICTRDADAEYVLLLALAKGIIMVLLTKITLLGGATMHAYNCLCSYTSSFCWNAEGNEFHSSK